MKVCYFGTYRKEYSRNKIMIAALEKAGIEVIQCHVKLWHGIQDRVDAVEGGWKKPDFWWRVVKAYLVLIWRFQKVGDFDILMVGYPGQFDVFLAKIFAILKRKPLVWDVFMSIYLIAKERDLIENHKFIIFLIRCIEHIALRLPNLLIQDTIDYVIWFEKEYKVSRKRFILVPTGADDRIFKPHTIPKNSVGEKFVILYYGSFIPNHGVMKIAEAIKQLKNRKEIRFRFIGEGPEKSNFQSYIKRELLDNVEIIGWMSQMDLINQINRADICLGAFGNTPQSLMTIQNKIFECMAMGKPVITGDSPAIRTGLPPETVILCSRENVTELSKAIINLTNDHKMLNKLSVNSFEVYNKYFSLKRLGEKLSNYLNVFVVKKQNDAN